jgi:hypothetical protein
VRPAWNLQSKRFLLVAVMTAGYLALLVFAPEVGAPLTPYAYGLIAAYCGFESWKPTGV